MFWVGSIVGFIAGVIFCIAWVLFEFGLECLNLAGRKFTYSRKHGWFPHAAKLELERKNHEITGAS